MDLLTRLNKLKELMKRVGAVEYIKLHKIVYLLQETGLSGFNYQFDFIYYQVFSHELQSDIIKAIEWGLIDKSLIINMEGENHIEQKG